MDNDPHFVEYIKKEPSPPNTTPTEPLTLSNCSFGILPSGPPRLLHRMNGGGLLVQPGAN